MARNSTPIASALEAEINAPLAPAPAAASAVEQGPVAPALDVSSPEPVQPSPADPPVNTPGIRRFRKWFIVAAHIKVENAHNSFAEQMHEANKEATVEAARQRGFTPIGEASLDSITHHDDDKVPITELSYVVEVSPVSQEV